MRDLDSENENVDIGQLPIKPGVQALNSKDVVPNNVEKEEFETIRDLLVLLLLKSGVSYESIADVTGDNPKTLRNRFPITKLVRKGE